MNFTVSTMAQSLAAYLAPHFPGFSFYEDPNQQRTKTPCMFLQQRSADIERRQGERWLRTIRLDLTYLLDYNLPDMQQRYQSAAETLDLLMETFPYSDGTLTALMRTYDREWTIDLDAMHYKFSLKIWVEQPQTGNPMETLDYNAEVKQ